METTMHTYLIPDSNMPELEKRLEQLNKRARRLHVPEITMTKTPGVVKFRVNQLTVDGHINSRVWLTRDQIDAKKATATANPAAYLAAAFEETGEAQMWWNVEVTGTTPRYNGWTFVAVLEPLTITETNEELNMIRTMPGETCPLEFRNIIGRCDHCHTKRDRKETFVVRNEAGEHKSVGRQCVKDFLGYNGDPQVIAHELEMLAQLDSLFGSAESEEWMGGYNSGERSWDIHLFLAQTASRIRLFGWMGRGKARELRETGVRDVDATADVVLEIFTPPMGGNADNRIAWEKLVKAHPITDADRALADEAIEWAKTLTAADLDNNEYLNNVNLVARVGVVNRKTAGVAASIIVAYNKAMERETNRRQAAERPESNWIGTEGQRIQLIRVKVEKIIMTEGAYGVTGIHKMTDEQGNELTWFASGGAKLDEGRSYNVALTVKKHDEFRNRKQTVVSRLTVWTDEGLAEYKAKEERKAARAAKKAAKAVVAAK